MGLQYISSISLAEMSASTISMFCDLILIDGNVVDFLFTRKTKERKDDDIEVEMSDFIP